MSFNPKLRKHYTFRILQRLWYSCRNRKIIQKNIRGMFMADPKIYKNLECSKGGISKCGKRIVYSINTTEKTCYVSYST